MEGNADSANAISCRDSVEHRLRLDAATPSSKLEVSERDCTLRATIRVAIESMQKPIT